MSYDVVFFLMVFTFFSLLVFLVVLFVCYVLYIFQEEISKINYMKNQEAGVPILVLFYDPEDEEGTKKAVELVSSVALEFRGVVRAFMWDG